MEETSKVLVFGSRARDIAKNLLELYSDASNPLLTTFFEQCYRTMRTEVGELPQDLGNQFPRSSSIADLCALYDQGALHAAQYPAFLCMHQLASFLQSVQCGQNHGYYPEASWSYVVGYGIGALSAVAASCSQNVQQFLTAALAVIKIALKVGLVTSQAANSIEPLSTFKSSWSACFRGLSFKDALSALAKFTLDEVYHLKETFPTLNREISGPPHLLSKFSSSQMLRGIEIEENPGPAPLHAPHLYSAQDLELVLQLPSSTFSSAYVRNLPLILSGNGKFSWTTGFRALLEEALSSILFQKVRRDLTIQTLISFCHAERISRISVSSSGSPEEGTICKAVAEAGLEILDTAMGQERPSGLSSYSYDGTATSGINANPSQLPFQSIAKSKIAVVGMSGRFPCAENIDSFWNLLYKGSDVHTVVPLTRWKAETHVDTTGKVKNTSKTPFGCWLENAGLFDAKFFHLSPREAPQVDPAQRIALHTTYEAIEMAGIVPGATPSTQKDRVGVFFGVTSNDWMETNSAQNIDTYMIPGGNRAFIPGRINYFFKFSGPSYSIDTACSSSLASIHTACNSLWRGDIDTAIVGGTNVLTNPDFTAGLDRGHFLSRTGNCKTFDDAADGYCRGEGVCTVILKRLEDAIADSDPIQGLILSASTNHSADADSITRPHGQAQRAIFQKLLHETATDPLDVSFVEMHGTGTQAGDAEEMKSVLEVFAPPVNDSKRARDDQHPLFLGSIKANIGHGEAASGVSSLAKVLLMMKHNTIPPHCGIKTKINHKFPTDLLERNVHIANKPISWPQQETRTRKVLLNNFSAAGGNSALILEDAPLRPTVLEADPRTYHCVAVSAKNAISLKGNIASVIKYLNANNCLLSALSYTTTARRIHHPHRVMVSGCTTDEIKAQLYAASKDESRLARRKGKPHIVFAFTGQGSSYAGMGKHLYKYFTSFRSHLNRLDHISQELGFPSFLPIITKPDADLQGFTPLIAQLAIVCLEMALNTLWISWGVYPQSVIGHSLGQYPALNAAGVLSELDTIYLVGKRAKLLEDHCQPNSHKMFAVKSSADAVKSLLSETGCEVACINGYENIVISGSRQMAKKAQDVLRLRGITTMPLNIPYAFHSSQVDPILDKLRDAARSVTFSKPSIPVICPTTSNVINEQQFDPVYVVDHCRGRVDIPGALEAAKISEAINEKSMVIEVGPQPVVSKMIKAVLGDSCASLSSLEPKGDPWKLLTKILSTLYVSGVELTWTDYHRDFKASHSVLHLPAYSWELKNYWMQYVNDWSLRKSDPIASVGQGRLPLKKDLALTSRPEAKSPRLESTTIHSVVKESIHGGQGELITEGDISRSDLSPLVQGHKVNGIPLCTPSVYAEIALSIGEYLLNRYGFAGKNMLVEVNHMVIEKALIAQSNGPQMLKTSVKVNLNKQSALCIFESYVDSGRRPLKHSQCTICFNDAKQRYAELENQAKTIPGRIAALEGNVSTGKVFRYSRQMVYRMVAALARFDPNYMALTEVCLDNDSYEASGLVSFDSLGTNGQFHTHPGLIDGLSQLGGFVMNGNDKCNLDEEVYINHGWESFQLFESLVYSKAYHTHVAMHESTDKKWQGDITIFDENRPIGQFKGIVLQGVGKRALHYILSRENELGASKAPQPSILQEKMVQGIPTETKKRQQLPVNTEVNQDLAEAPVQRVQSIIQTDDLSHSISKTRPSVAVYRKVDTAIRIVSEESGIGVNELTDNSTLVDLGIDSLLILIIVGRFKEELDVDLDSNAQNPISTVGDLKEYLSSYEQNLEKGVTTESMSPAVGLATSPPSTLPDLSRSSLTPPEPMTPIDSANSVKGCIGANNFSSALKIISEEIGVQVTELTDDTSLLDVGIDSLSSLLIVGRLRDELSIEFGNNTLLFRDFDTIKDVRKRLDGKSTAKEITPAINDDLNKLEPPRPSVQSPGEHMPTTWSHPVQEPSNSTPPSQKAKPASSVVLQGKPRNSKVTLFLFPDGAGSASSYTSLQNLAPDIAVIGFNCPYVRCPEEMTCAVNALITSYIDELRRRQTAGPYTLGGWSSGGVLAFAAAQRLIQEGEEVERLILIDSPPPTGLDRLPQSWFDFCTSTDLFEREIPQRQSRTQPPQCLVPHFKATIEMLHNYYADPLPQGFTPMTTVIWATESALKGASLPPGNDNTKGLKFLTEKRVDFSDGGWQQFFPDDEVIVEKVPGATHFSMMHRYAPALSDILRKTLL